MQFDWQTLGFWVGGTVATLVLKAILEQPIKRWVDATKAGTAGFLRRKVTEPIRRSIAEEEALKIRVREDASIRPLVMAAATYHLVKGLIWAVCMAPPLLLIGAYRPPDERPVVFTVIGEVFYFAGVLCICVGMTNVVKGRFLRYVGGHGILEKNLDGDKLDF